MNETDHERWIKLFEKIGNPRSVEILQEIDIGYNSIVYLVSVDSKHYAVKMYNERFNGTEVGIQEKSNIIKARKYIPAAVPNVHFFSKHRENDFDREIVVTEKATGVFPSKDTFNQHVFEELIHVLQTLHTSGRTKNGAVNELERLHTCRRVITRFVTDNASITEERVSKHLDALTTFYVTKKDTFQSSKTMIHGDLWWDNILVHGNDVTIVDWLEASEQDYCRDLAQIKIGILDEILDSHRSQQFLEKMLELYNEQFDDESIYDRIRFYLPLLFLEESFYLPFRYFPWKIKYNEDARSFEKRFIDYFEKSERFFNQ
jgi:thiamine kinase-like enzyme